MLDEIARHIDEVAVVGAGTMGTGIARLALAAGLPVCLSDVDEQALREARARLTHVGGHLVRYEQDTAAVEGCDVVLDATPNTAGKKHVLATIAARASADALLGVLTLSAPVSTLDRHPLLVGRLLGFHFMNPPHKLPFCELVVPDTVPDPLVVRARGLLQAMRVSAVEVKDHAGFVLNRALVPFLFSAVRTLEAGTAATAEDVDRAFVEGCRHPMGPLAILDLIGLDVAVRIGEDMHAATGDPSFRPPELLYALVRAGRLGRRAGGLHPPRA